VSNLRLGIALVALLLALLAGQNHYFQSPGAQEAVATAVCEPQSQACETVPDGALAPVTGVSSTVYSETCLATGDLHVLRYAVGDAVPQQLVASICG
jgi:hypothetical protein